MLEKIKKRLDLKSHVHGHAWQLDWYIDEIYCREMAFGTNPLYIGYFQPIIGDEFIDLKDEGEFKKKFESFFKETEAVKVLIEKQDKIINEGRNYLKEIKKKKTIIDFERYYKIQSKLALLMASVSVVLDNAINLECKEIALKEKIPLYKLSSYVIDQASQTKSNESNRKLIEKYRINPKINAKDLKEHAKIYGWLNTGDRGRQEWDGNDFYLQLQELIKDKKTDNKKIKVSSVSRKLIDFIILVSVNDNRASDIQIELDFCFQKFLKKELGKNYIESIIEQLTSEEIVSLVNGSKKIKDFEERKNNFCRVLYPYKGKVYSHYLEKKDYLKIVSEIKSNTSSVKKIKGVVACQGRVVGIVRVIKKLGDLEKFERGEIMVATQTQPDYTQYMMKAKAIITNIGGITSHAAIISREFGIPCIVGTQNATSILKNGDKVEVDAFKGIVNKIS
ncbi:hypothetical protein KKD37_03255 [Patescibacteria group bacterium]|nr:hypothetical protein [Patescibacteria group bacterium]